MKKCLSILFVLVLLSINNCGGESSKKGTYIATPNGEEEPFVAECEDHTDCYPDHSICVSGACTGDPQPEVLPNENVPATGGEDATTATETTGSGSGPWGNPNYNSDSSNENDQPEAPAGCPNWVFECVPCSVDADCVGAGFCADETTVQLVNAKCIDAMCELGEQIQCAINCVYDVNEAGQYYWTAYCYTDDECLDDSDCDDADDCTYDNCVDGKCGNTQLWTDECGGEPDMPHTQCDVDSDCNDNNECTDNVCYDGECEYDVITNCKTCTEDADCGEELANYWCDDEGNVHNASQPKCASGVCGQDVVVTYCGEQGCDECNECAIDADCDDNDALTTDICWVGECFHAAVDVECYAGDSCDDKNGCTTDYCDKGYCNHIGSDGCKTCATDFDCDDNNVCTVDICAPLTLTCGQVDICLYSGEWKKLICETDVDCAGKGLGEYCVGSQYETSLCQECSNLSNNLHPCPTGKICKWGIVGGEGGNWLSDYHCENECNCDDGNACTIDTCNANGTCLHETMEYCEPCKTAADCDESFVGYFCEDANYQTTYSAFKCTAGICNQTISSLKCKYGCANSSCNECTVNSDCDDKNNTTVDLCVFPDPPVGAKECIHESAELKCSFSSCPDTLQNVVIWYGNNLTATVKCDGAELFKVSPETLCLWGAKNPVFKYNLWNGGDVWSGGDKAVLSCNDEAIKVTPQGTAGVQIVSFTDLLCEF